MGQWQMVQVVGLLIPSCIGQEVIVLERFVGVPGSVQAVSHELSTRFVLVLDELLDRDGPSPATSTLMQVPPAVARGWILGMFPAPSATRPETMA